MDKDLEKKLDEIIEQLKFLNQKENNARTSNLRFTLLTLFIAYEALVITFYDLGKATSEYSILKSSTTLFLLYGLPLLLFYFLYLYFKK